MNWRNTKSVLGAALIFMCAAGLASAQLRPIQRPGEPILPPPRPGGVATIAPSGSPAPGVLSPGVRPTLAPIVRGALKEVAPGTHVPLMQLPALPLINTVNTLSTHNKRPMAADGSTINLTISSGCSSTSGVLYNINCQVTWKAANLPSSTDSYQYYSIAPGAGTGTAGGTFTNNPTTQGPITLSTAGIWTFALYDVTKTSWKTVVYVNVGSATDIGTYQDSFYSQTSSQFDVSSSSFVYILASGVSSSDTYVTYIEQTSSKPACVYMAPSPGVVAGTALCNPTTVLVGQAPVGTSLKVIWPINSSYAGGTYSIVLYDKTNGTRVGQTQVSFTSSSGITMKLTPDDTYANPSPAPIPVPTAGTIFAWDGSTDQSTSGVVLSSAGTATSAQWTVTDPTGRVIGTTAGGTSYTYNFNLGGMLVPGSYPPKVFTASLYDKSNSTVIASQSFSVVGYYNATYFDIGSGNTTSMSLGPGATQSSKLIFLNNSNTVFGSGNGDGFSKIAFTTGGDFAATAGNGDGVMAYISGTQCGSQIAGCTQTGNVNDTAGHQWDITDNCSAFSSFFSFATVNGECAIFLTPHTAGVVLAPGASITLTGVLFSHDFWSSCFGGFGYLSASCGGSTSVLPQHGQTWSEITQATAANEVTFDNSAGVTSAGTAHWKLVGAITAAGTFPAGLPGTQADDEAHLYKAYSSQVAYARTTPYSLATTSYNIYELKVTNNSTCGFCAAGSDNISKFAVALPGSYGSTSVSSNNFSLPASLNPAGWVLTDCTGTAGSTGSAICIDGTAGGKSIAAGGGSVTFYVEANPPTTSFATTEFQIAATSPYAFALTADSGALSIPVGSSGALVTVDSLAFGVYSLNSSLMAATFSPSTAGQGTAPTETITYTNATSGSDPNPDYIDNVLIAAPSTISTSANPSAVTSGWSYLGTITSGGTKYWWFSVCSNGQNVVGNLPPASTPLTSVFPQFTACTSAQLTHALGPGQSLQMTFPFSTFSSSGTNTFTYYGHGANAGGWSGGGTFALNVTSVSASAGFTVAGGSTPGGTTAVSNGSIPTIGADFSAVYGNGYTYTVKNTSNTNPITSFSIRIPGVDTSGANATDVSGQTWVLTNTPVISSGANGCTVVSSSSATTAGADGAINIGGGSCSLPAGSTMTLTWTMKGPSTANDTFQFTTQNINAASITAGESWQYDTYIKVSLTVGLSVVVNPSNPGPGGSAPNPTCPASYPCSFSGTTIDFGNVANNLTNAYTDVVRASVYITSATTVNWTLSVQASTNPARTPAAPTNELLTDVDSTNSTQDATHITFDKTSYTVIPTGSSLQVAHGTNVLNSSTPLDIIQNFELSLGTEALNATSSTLTYTLIAN